MMKKFYILFALITAFSLQNTFGQNAEVTSTRLVVEGNILGYELNEVKLSSMDGYFPEYPALFKISKVLEGENTSQYIIVLLKPFTKEDADKHFGLNKTITFKLVRRMSYIQKLKDLLHSGFTMKNGKVVETAQTFTFAAGVEKQKLPLDKKIQCYVEIDKDVKF